jgi:hypothetical protein
LSPACAAKGIIEASIKPPATIIICIVFIFFSPYGINALLHAC